MNSAKIKALKAVAEQAQNAYLVEQKRLVEAGIKSKDRYPLLKELKAVVDAAHAEYSNTPKVKFTKN